MTFESMSDANVNATSVANPLSAPSAPVLAEPMNEETLVVKVFFGNDIRRATFNGGYARLLDVCAKICDLDPANAVLKYQDEDGDKITMSSDGELQEARKLVKDKTLRVFVENKATPAIPAQAPPVFPGYNFWMHGGPMRGGHRGRGGFQGYGGHHGFQQYGAPHHHMPHPHPHPPPHPHPHQFPHPPTPFGGHGLPHPSPNGSPFQAPASPSKGDQPSQNGSFSPADPSSHFRNARFDSSPYARNSYWRDDKKALKEHMRFMKANCNSESDREAIKLFKEQMHQEWKAEKKAAKMAQKAEKKAGKYDKNEERKSKKECKKDKCKKDKDGKKDRFIARHVADVTIPDNSELPADTPVTKTWRLRNDGVLTWPADSQLLFISRRGDDLNGPERVFVGAVEPQAEVEVSVTFVTPSESGRYIGYYRMATGDGCKFGQRVWVSFVVPGGPINTTHSGPIPYPTSPAPAAGNNESRQAAVLDVAME